MSEQNIRNIEVENESLDDDVLLMEEPFDPMLINIDTKTPSMDTLIKRIERGSIALNTEEYFQRADNLWSNMQQSRLIESILIRFPLPAFFFDATNDSYWLVVDGLQRLSSIRNFCVLKTLKLTNLEFLSQLEGLGWEDLSDDLKRVIEESQVVINKIMPGTPTDVKFNIFKRINTGGLVLESQEIRHALFQGIPAQFVADLAKIDTFVEVVGVSSKRMLDRDFVNRFLAFYLFGYDEYQSDLDLFMSKAMAALHNITNEDRILIKQRFESALSLAHKIFNKDVFRKFQDGAHHRSPINKALFDAVATQFAKIPEHKHSILLTHKQDVKEKLKNLLSQDSYFFSSITSSTNDKNKVRYRHETIKKLIIEIVGNYD